jgi:hypothetical protein
MATETVTESGDTKNDAKGGVTKEGAAKRGAAERGAATRGAARKGGAKQRSSSSSRIRELLAQHPGRTFSPAEVAAELSVEREKVTYLLVDLTRRGVIAKTGRAAYTAADLGDPETGAATPQGGPATTDTTPAVEDATAKKEASGREVSGKGASRPSASGKSPRRATKRQRRPRATSPTSSVATSEISSGQGLHLVGALSDGRLLFEYQDRLWEGQPFTR